VHDDFGENDKKQYRTDSLAIDARYKVNHRAGDSQCDCRVAVDNQWSFTVRSNDWQLLLRAGALPAPLNCDETYRWTSDLGSDFNINGLHFLLASLVLYFVADIYVGDILAVGD